MHQKPHRLRGIRLVLACAFAMLVTTLPSLDTVRAQDVSPVPDAPQLSSAQVAALRVTDQGALDKEFPHYFGYFIRAEAVTFAFESEATSEVQEDLRQRVQREGPEVEVEFMSTGFTRERLYELIEDIGRTGVGGVTYDLASRQLLILAADQRHVDEAVALAENAGIPARVVMVTYREEACTGRSDCTSLMQSGLSIYSGPMSSAQQCTGGFFTKVYDGRRLLTSSHCNDGYPGHPWRHCGLGIGGHGVIGYADYDFRSLGYDLLRVVVPSNQHSSRFYYGNGQPTGACHTQQSNIGFWDITSAAALGISAGGQNPPLGQQTCISAGYSDLTACGRTVASSSYMYWTTGTSVPSWVFLVDAFSTPTVQGDSGSPVIMSPWQRADGTWVIDAAGVLKGSIDAGTFGHWNLVVPIWDQLVPRGQLGELVTQYNWP